MNDVDHEFDVEFSFKPPFDKMLEPIKEDISKINSAIRNHSSKLEKFIDIAKGHIQDFLECGLSDVDNPSNMTTHSNNGYFFRHNSSSKELLVEARGVEPLSENASKGTSPGADAYFGIAPVFLRHRSNVKPAGRVASLCMVRSKLCALTSASDRRPASGPRHSRRGRVTA